MTRTFLEARLFGAGDRFFTWVRIAGIIWLLVGLNCIVLSLALMSTVWYGDRGLAIAVLGVVLPLWFARKFLVRLSAFWVIVAAIYGLVVMLGVVVVAGSIDGSIALLLALMIPTVASALAFWELHREPGHSSA